MICLVNGTALARVAGNAINHSPELFHHSARKHIGHPFIFVEQLSPDLHSRHFPRGTSPRRSSIHINPIEVVIVHCTFENLRDFVRFQNAVQFCAAGRLLRRVIENSIVQKLAGRPVDLPQICYVDSLMCFLQSGLVLEPQLGIIAEIAPERGKTILVQRQHQVRCKVPFFEPLVKSHIRVIVARRRNVVAVIFGIQFPCQSFLLCSIGARLVFDLPR